MFRQSLVAAVFVGVVVSVGACSGGNSGGPSSPTTPSSSSTTSATSSAPAAPSSSSTESTAPAPTGFGESQPAVDAYAAYQNLSNEGLRTPSSFNAAALATVSAGQARQVLSYAIADEQRQGRAYRGTPWELRVKIKSASLNGSLPSVVMTDCPRPNDTWVEYSKRTGSPVPKTKSKIPPPYLATIKAFQPNRKSWVITSYTLDGSKTCDA